MKTVLFVAFALTLAVVAAAAEPEVDHFNYKFTGWVTSLFNLWVL
jgi:hypothetical protein